MKRYMMLAAGLVLPFSLYPADVHVSVSVNSSDGIEYDDAECVEEGDPWFEESADEGPVRVSFEYQWVLAGSRHVLRYRRVTFNTIGVSWWFGPWSVMAGYCHPSCQLPHPHHFYHCHAPSVHWVRRYHSPAHRHYPSGGFYYEYHAPVGYSFGRPRVYRHEYRKPYSGHHYRHGEAQGAPGRRNKGYGHDYRKPGGDGQKPHHREKAGPPDRHRPAMHGRDGETRREGTGKGRSSPAVRTRHKGERHIPPEGKRNTKGALKRENGRHATEAMHQDPSSNHRASGGNGSRSHGSRNRGISHVSGRTRSR